MGLANYAKEEFRILREENPDAVVLQFEDSILDLVHAFAESGQSGGSAPFVSNAITSTIDKLLRFKPLVGIMDEESYWMEVAEGMYQHKRLSAMFKSSNYELPYYNGAILIKPLESNCFISSNHIYTNEGREYLTKGFIKTFPFYPKTFEIECNESQDGFWVMTDAGMEEFKKAQEYYHFLEAKKGGSGL